MVGELGKGPVSPGKGRNAVLRNHWYTDFWPLVALQAKIFKVTEDGHCVQLSRTY